MKYCILDVETTTYEKGHPFADKNKLCYVGIRTAGVSYLYDIEFSLSPYNEQLRKILELLNRMDVVAGFNLKFDLNWLARYGIRLRDHVNVFDCQLVEFILSHQQTRFPSLDDCLSKYGLPPKSDIVERVYWANEIDTPLIPVEILEKYLSTDLEVTDALYTTLSKRLAESESNKRVLCSLHMQDLRVLQEMEFNGIRLNWTAMEQKGQEVEKELNEINRQILQYCPQKARGWFNTGSNDHVSALLYGGVISGKEPSPYEHTIKTGDKAGEVVSRNRWSNYSVKFPRLVKPLKGTELKKEGFWGTGADILRELLEAKPLRGLLLKQAELSKLLSTYYQGFPKIAAKKDWKDGNIHSSLHQCVAITGRLSSSGVNQQNMPELMNEYIVSRFT